MSCAGRRGRHRAAGGTQARRGGARDCAESRYTAGGAMAGGRMAAAGIRTTSGGGTSGPVDSNAIDWVFSARHNGQIAQSGGWCCGGGEGESESSASWQRTCLPWDIGSAPGIAPNASCAARARRAKNRLRKEEPLGSMVADRNMRFHPQKAETMLLSYAEILSESLSSKVER